MKKSIFLFFAAILCSMSIDAYAATQRYIYVGLSNNYHQWKNASQWGINHWGGTGAGVVPGSKITDLKTTFKHSGCTFHMYRMYVYDDNKNFEFKGNDGWWDCKKENISISGTTKNALLFRDNDGGDGGSPTLYQTNYQEESAVSLSASSNSVSVGEEVILTPKLTSNAEYNEIASTTYSVGTGATVSDGKFVATTAGTYTVTATITYNPKKFTGITKKVENITCEIVVSEVAIPHPVTGVTVAPTSVTIKQGATATLTATVSPSNADDPSITWSSDNTSVATVVNGVVTAVAAGTANITVTTVDGGFTATCAVKVKPLQYTFYAINSAEWPTVAAHYWEGADGGSAWPGANMVKESETINGFDIYSITISSDFVNIMFTNQIDGDNNKKTADLTTEGNDGKYYDIKDAKWYASLSEVPVSYDYYLTGSLVGGWDPKQKGIEKDGELYKATFTDLAAGEYEFKITKGDWAQQWNYSNLDKAYEEVSEGKDGEGNPNGNIKIVTTAVKTITVNFDATANKISLEGLTPYVAPLTYTVTVPAGTEKCFIAGAMNGWNFQEMTATANANEFTIEIAGARETDGYKYACQASWDYVEKDKDGNDLADNRTWKENDKVENWGKPVVVTYQLKGVGGWDQPGIELVQNPGNDKEYMLTCQAISATDAVKVVKLADGVITDYYGKGTVKDGVEVTVNYDGDNNITLPEGTYDFYFDTNEAEKKLWIAAATGCVTEPEYNVVEDQITNFVFDTEAWPMVCMGGPSTNYQIEVFLTLTEDADGTLAYEDCSVSIMGTDATFIDGTLSNIDPFAPYADAVLHVQWDGDYYELQLAMSSTPAAAITIEAEDATVTLTEYPTNFEETEFAYELAMVANWVNEAESLPYRVEFIIPTFDPTKASGEYIANFYVTGEGDAAGMNENVSVTVTKDGNNVTLTGNVSALNGNAYNATISGTLPTETPDYTRTVTPGNYGTLCLPYASSSYSGAEFYEVSWLQKNGETPVNLYLDQLAADAQLEAGKPYIFRATSTELTVTYTGAAVTEPVAGANGLTGSFVEIPAGGVLTGNYVVAQTKFWTATADAYAAANRAYIDKAKVPYTEQKQIPGRRRVALGTSGENAETGIDNIITTDTPVKVIENGQLIIIRDGEMYNAMGVKL